MSGRVLVKNNKNGFISFLKGIFISILISIVGILLFAVVLKFFSLNDLVIKIINQIIKILSVLFGVKVAFKRQNNNTLIKGLGIGVFYTLFAYLIFSLFSSSFSFGLSFLFDCLFAGVFGVIFGVIFSNARR